MQESDMKGEAFFLKRLNLVMSQLKYYDVYVNTYNDRDNMPRKLNLNPKFHGKCAM